MAELWIWVLVFVVSLAVLIKFSDIFTETAGKIGVFLGLSPFLVGVTIVAIGTSLPELVSSIFAITQGATEIIPSNVIGSNIANIFLIIGVATVISSPLKISYNLLDVDLPLFVGSAFLLYFTLSNGRFSRVEAILCILGYLIHLAYTIRCGQIETPTVSSQIGHRSKYLLKQSLILIFCTMFMFLGANYTIKSITEIADILEIGKELVAISAVAIGTSLPELAVTISASRRGDAEVAIGNVLGSNIFNSLIVMGVPGLIDNLIVPDTIIKDGLPMLLAATLLFFFVTQDKKVTKWEGWLFFVLYAWFIGNLFNLV
ncbi:MAG: calcium/sodium antiporter [Cyanobacteriota bacterium]|nr:calcium/sodium antiporter [Cyanobacteriota bacterium]